jgi:integrase
MLQSAAKHITSCLAPGFLAFQADGIVPEHWTTTSPIREIFKNAFQAVGLPYYNPYSFRHTLGHLMNRYCKDIEQMHAWSQNLGHDSPITTYTSYGHMEPYRQGEVIRSLVNIPLDRLEK